MSTVRTTRRRQARRLIRHALPAMTVGALVAPSFAQSSGELQTVEVTAQKRVQNMQVVPISVDAASAVDLERAGVKDLFNLGDLSPSVTGGQANRTIGSRMGIRGINDFARNAGYDSSMGVYVDGVYAGRTEASSQGLTGIERVEILRGPQGTLFGKNTIAGALSLTTRKPTERLEASANVDVGEFGTRNAGVWIGGAVVPGTVLGSFSASTERSDGYVDNVNNPGVRPGSGHGDSARGFARIKPMKALEIDVSLSTYKYSGVPMYGEGIAPATAPFLVPGAHTTSTNADSLETVKKTAGAVTVNYDLPGGQRLTSITAHHKARNAYRNDEDMSPLDILIAPPDSIVDTRQTTQELRLASAADPQLDWLVGLFYMKQNNDQDGSTATGSQFPVAPLRGITSRNIGSLDTTSSALFAHGNAMITTELQFTGGLRYTRETKNVVFQQSPIPGLITNIPQFGAGFTDTDLSPKLGLNWFAQKDLMVYGFYTQGFKSGGYNLDTITTPVTNPAADLKFDKQTVKSVEVGVKSELMDRRLRLNAALFTMDGSNWQVQQFVPQPNNTSLITITNAGKVKIDGAEVEMTAQALPSLLLKAGVAYTDATFVEFRNGGGPGINYDGNRLTFAPRVKTSLAAEHSLEIGSMLLRSSLVYTHTGQQYSNPNNAAIATIPQYEVLNARVALEGGATSRWSVALWVKNLTNKEYVTFQGLNPLTTPRAIYGQPRTTGISLSMDL